MRRIALCLCFALLGFVAQAAQVTDERGVTVTFAQAPQRIVSVLPSLTESVCALGACERLVGVDRYSNWPASVKSLAQVGGGLDLNIEAIVRLKPDVVLLATSSRAASRLEQLGIKVLAFEPSSHEQVRRSLQQIDAMLGTGQAAAVWAGIERELAQAAAQMPAKLRGARVYFEVDRSPYAAGEASFIGETLTRLGLRNIVGKELGAFPKINPEFVVVQQPDLIVLSERHAKDLPLRPGWRQLRALQNQAVCELTPEQGDGVVRSGPRMGAGAIALVQCMAKAVAR